MAQSVPRSHDSAHANRYPSISSIARIAARPFSCVLFFSSSGQIWERMADGDCEGDDDDIFLLTSMTTNGLIILQKKNNGTSDFRLQFFFFFCIPRGHSSFLMNRRAYRSSGCFRHHCWYSWCVHRSGYQFLCFSAKETDSHALKLLELSCGRLSFNICGADSWRDFSFGFPLGFCCWTKEKKNV